MCWIAMWYLSSCMLGNVKQSSTAKYKTGSKWNLLPQIFRISLMQCVSNKEVLMQMTTKLTLILRIRKDQRSNEERGIGKCNSHMLYWEKKIYSSRLRATYDKESLWMYFGMKAGELMGEKLIRVTMVRKLWRAMIINVFLKSLDR